MGGSPHNTKLRGWISYLAVSACARVFTQCVCGGGDFTKWIEKLRVLSFVEVFCFVFKSRGRFAIAKSRLPPIKTIQRCHSTEFLDFGFVWTTNVVAIFVYLFFLGFRV